MKINTVLIRHRNTSERANCNTFYFSATKYFINGKYTTKCMPTKP